MHQVIRRMPGSNKSGTTARYARGVIGVRRVWAHECGAEAVEALALVAALIALLALLSLVVRDQAAAIGGAATATLARWLTGAPGAASVGGTAGITPLTLVAPPHTVVGLPQLLVQTTDAAPWATWGIGIVGSLLSAAAAWRTATGGALPADAGAWLRPVGTALDWIVRQGAGLGIGFVEGVADTISGLVTLVGDLGKLIAGDAATRRRYGALLEALARDPLGTLASILQAIVAPIVTDWQAGRYGEAIGRAVFELLPALLAIVTGGGSAAGYAAKAGSAGKMTDAVADAGRIVSHVDDVGRVVERVDDAARGVDALADAGRTLNRVDDVGRIPQIKGFATPQKLSEHFKKHRAEFGFTSESEYLAAAQKFASSQPGSDVLVKIRANGDRVIYNVSTNEFAVVTPDGTIRTYFKPDPAKHGYPTNLDYFNAQ